MQSGWITDDSGRLWLIDTQHIPASTISVLTYCKNLLKETLDNAEYSKGIFKTPAAIKNSSAALDSLDHWLSNLTTAHRKIEGISAHSLRYINTEWVQPKEYAQGIVTPLEKNNLWDFSLANRPAKKSRHASLFSNDYIRIPSFRLFPVATNGAGVPSPFSQWFLDDIRAGLHDDYFDKKITKKTAELATSTQKSYSLGSYRQNTKVQAEMFVEELGVDWIKQTASLFGFNPDDTQALAIPMLRPSKAKPCPANMQPFSVLQTALSNHASWIAHQKKTNWDAITRTLAVLEEHHAYLDQRPKNPLSQKDAIYVKLALHLAREVRQLCPVNVAKSSHLISEGKMMQSGEAYIIYGTHYSDNKGFWTGNKVSSHITAALCFTTEKEALSHANRKLGGNYSVVKIQVDPKSIHATFGSVDINELGGILSIKEREEIQKAIVDAQIQEATDQLRKTNSLYEEKLRELGVDPATLSSPALNESEPTPAPRRSARI